MEAAEASDEEQHLCPYWLAVHACSRDLFLDDA